MILDDLVFRNRNKEYGAYRIRKKYRKTVIISLITSVLIVLLLLTFQAFLDFRKQKNEKLIIPPKVIAAELTVIDIEELKPKEVAQPFKNQVKPFIAELLHDSIKKADSVATKKDITTERKNDEKIIQVEQAEFNNSKFVCGGNMLAFRQWFMDNFKYPDDLNIKKTEGRILLYFIINSKGMIDSAWIVSGIDPAIDNEAKRVILTSPRWKPCIINGKPLKQMYQFPIYLVRRK
jgi:periplasmic protein TonB